MTEDGQASQWVPSGPKLDEKEKANVHRMLHLAWKCHWITFEWATCIDIRWHRNCLKSIYLGGSRLSCDKYACFRKILSLQPKADLKWECTFDSQFF